jgi:hypothetical protein
MNKGKWRYFSIAAMIASTYFMYVGQSNGSILMAIYMLLFYMMSKD